MLDPIYEKFQRRDTLDFAAVKISFVNECCAELKSKAGRLSSVLSDDNTSSLILGATQTSESWKESVGATTYHPLT